MFVLRSILLVVLLAGCAAANRPLQLLSTAELQYPEQALNEGVQGSVVVVYDVEMTGRVANLRVLESEPEGVFNQAALDYVRSWRFNPPMVDGEPVAAPGRRSTITFRLGNSDEYDRY